MVCGVIVVLAAGCFWLEQVERKGQNLGWCFLGGGALALVYVVRKLRSRMRLSVVGRRLTVECHWDLGTIDRHTIDIDEHTGLVVQENISTKGGKSYALVLTSGATRLALDSGSFPSPDDCRLRQERIAPLLNEALLPAP